MIRFNIQRTQKLHDFLIKETGGKKGIKDSSLLDLSLQNPFLTFDLNDLYPSIEEKAARLCYSLISNHTFIDGNKRIGMLVMLTFLEINGIPINTNNEEIIRVGISIASGTMKYNDIVIWILENRTNIIHN